MTLPPRKILSFLPTFFAFTLRDVIIISDRAPNYDILLIPWLQKHLKYGVIIRNIISIVYNNPKQSDDHLMTREISII